MTNEITLMTVDQKTIGHVLYPRILFNDDWLIKRGFEFETLVSAIFEDGFLILKACGYGISAYKEIVTEVRAKLGQLFYVAIDPDSKKTVLVIEGSWLERLGFKIGDLIVVQVIDGCLKVKKLLPKDVGFNHDMFLNFIIVGQDSKNKPLIFKCATWIHDTDFKIGGSAMLTHHDLGQTITLSAPQLVSCHPSKNRRADDSPTQINITNILAPRNRAPIPKIAFKGKWLTKYGYEPGDPLLIGYQSDLIVFKKIDLAIFFS